MTLVDAHLHVWRATSGQAPDVRTLVPPQTDVPIELASKTLLDHSVERAVLVQPVFRGEDNSYIARCATADPGRFAAVCVVDPRLPGADVRLEHWVGQGCRGLRMRPSITSEAAVFGDPATYGLWQAAQRLGIVVSLLANLEHVRTIDKLAARFAGTPIAIDHLGQPDVAAGARSEGFRRLLDLAERPNIWIKLSGFYHFSRQQFPFSDCHDIVRALFDRFGPQRLLWGSDFPHVLLACGYGGALLAPEQALDKLADADRLAIMGLNAVDLYWART